MDGARRDGLPILEPGPRRNAPAVRAGDRRLAVGERPRADKPALRRANLVERRCAGPRGSPSRRGFFARVGGRRLDPARRAQLRDDHTGADGGPYPYRLADGHTRTLSLTLS